MIAIFKYVFPQKRSESILMPAGARVVHFDIQGAAAFPAACFWAIVDTEKPYEGRHFRILVTGAKIDEGLEYIATARYDRDGFLGREFWHLFEEK